LIIKRKNKLILGFFAWMIMATCIYYAGGKIAIYKDQQAGLRRQIQQGP